MKTDWCLCSRKKPKPTHAFQHSVFERSERDDGSARSGRHSDASFLKIPQNKSNRSIKVVVLDEVKKKIFSNSIILRRDLKLEEIICSKLDRPGRNFIHVHINSFDDRLQRLGVMSMFVLTVLIQLATELLRVHLIFFNFKENCVSSIKLIT
jgi:hypothetical protein